MNKYALFLVFVLFFVSCGKSEEEEERESIFLTNLYLSQGKCSDALSTITNGDVPSSSYEYAWLRAAAEVCPTSYTETEVYQNLVSDLDTDDTDIVGSITTFNISDETQADSADFLNLMDAIEVLTAAGGTSTRNHAARAALLTANQAANINIQGIPLVTAALGKFFQYYGQPDAAGIKGNCIADYDDAAAQAILPAGTACNAGSLAFQPEMDNSDLDAAIRRLCYGVVIINHFIDMVDNTTFTNPGDTGDLSSVSISSNPTYTNACAASGNGICTLYSVDECIAANNPPTIPIQSTAELQRFFAGLENLFL